MFAVVIALRYLLPKDLFKKFKQELANLLSKHLSATSCYTEKEFLKDSPKYTVERLDYTEEFVGENKRKIFELVPPGGYWRDIDPEIAKAYMKSCWDMEGGRTGILRRMSLDEPSLTVLTSPSQKQTERCHPLEARPFTVRENARCQTFPDEWQFCGSVQSQYKQVGNAVPVNLAYEIGLEIHKSLEGVK